MFCDMVNFTPLVEKIGSEAAYELMDQVYELLMHAVHAFGGTVNELTGDGIMALFGAPIAIEDAPQRAIRSSMAIHRELARFSRRWNDRHHLEHPLNMRIGIHTGPVVVGSVGSDLKMEFKAVGDTVNLASRIEGVAQPGTTCVTEKTFKLVEGYFRFKSLGAKRLKGKTKPVKVYRPIASRRARTRFDVAANRGLTPFTGRERELDQLIDAFEITSVGKGQVIAVISEAGAGKSRLLYEFRWAVSHRDATFVEGQCLSYSRNIAFHPIKGLMKSIFDIHTVRSDQEIRNRVENGLRNMGALEGTTMTSLLDLLDVKQSESLVGSLSPDAWKDHLSTALKRIIVCTAAQHPLIIVIEDLHWMDSSSTGVLKSLLDVVPGNRFLLVTSHRPGVVHPGEGLSFYRQMALGRLSAEESRKMISHLLGRTGLEKTYRQCILEKGEGIPFYIEEFARSVRLTSKDAHAVTDQLSTRQPAVPLTLEEVIMSRVDALSASAREVLQAGSAIEREFDYVLLKRITNLTDAVLHEKLKELEEAELIYRREAATPETYSFNHMITREVVYGAILSRRKKSLHRSIALALEALFKDCLEGHYEILAEHYMRSDDSAKAASYAKRSARKALKTASPYDAIHYIKMEIKCLESMSADESVKRMLVDARTKLGLYYTQINYHVPAREAVKPILHTTKRLGYAGRLSQIYTVLGAFEYMVNENFTTAYEYLNEAIALSKASQNMLSYVQASYWLGLGLSLDCDFAGSYRCLELVLASNQAVNNLWGIAATQSVISYFVHYLSGDIEQAHQMSKAAVASARKSKDIYAKAMADVAFGVTCLSRYFPIQAKRHLLSGAELCGRLNIFSWNALAQTGLAEASMALGDYASSETYFSDAAYLIRQNRILPSWMRFCMLGAACAKARQGETGIDVKTLAEFTHQNRIRAVDGSSRRYFAELLAIASDGNASQALSAVQQAICADESNKMPFHLGLDYSLCSRIRRLMGDNESAGQCRAKAVDLFRSCSADGWATANEIEQ